MFGICVENLGRISKKANLILRYKIMLFDNFNNSSKAELKFNNEYLPLSL